MFILIKVFPFLQALIYTQFCPMLHPHFWMYSWSLGWWL